MKALWNDERGNVLVIAAAALPMVAGAAGLATDTIQWTLVKRQLQRAADSAAIAGTYQRDQDSGATTNVSSAVNTDLAVNQQTGLTLASQAIATPSDTSTYKNQVEVTLTVTKALPFSSIFLSSPPTIKAYAKAAGVPGSDKYIAIALGNSASLAGIRVTGGASLDFGDYGLITNSTASNAAIANSAAASVDASVIAAVGDVQESSAWHVDKYDPYTTSFVDPYTSLTSSSYSSTMKCTTRKLAAVTKNNGSAAQQAYSWADASALGYNCFSAIDVASGTTVDLTTATTAYPSGYTGPIFVNGGDVTIQGTMTATKGNTIVMTNTSSSTSATIGTFTMNASGNLKINAPSTGTFAGIAIYQDKRATDTSGHTSKVNGNSSSIINGAIYMPSTELNYNGGSTIYTETCARFVVKRVNFSGSSGTNAFKQDCSAYGVPDWTGGTNVRLIA